MFIFPNVFSKEYLLTFKNIISNNYNEIVDKDETLWDSWEAMAVSFPTNSDIVFYLKNYLENFLKINLKCVEFQGQIWPVNGSFDAHKHSSCDYRGSFTRYNSIVYLNDDFEGGEFYIEYGVRLKPQPGTVTLFNGLDYIHGISEVKKNHRYTLILWWDKESDFNKSNIA